MKTELLLLVNKVKNVILTVESTYRHTSMSNDLMLCFVIVVLCEFAICKQGKVVREQWPQCSEFINVVEFSVSV